LRAQAEQELKTAMLKMQETEAELLGACLAEKGGGLTGRHVAGAREEVEEARLALEACVGACPPDSVTLCGGWEGAEPHPNPVFRPHPRGMGGGQGQGKGVGAEPLRERGTL